MGNFFTSSHIYNNEDLNSQKFIDKFCMKMAEEGYVTCDSDESELSYILRFGENCKWVTITSESYEEGNQTSQKDTGRLAKMLKTVCVNTVVNDSDFAVMDLYDESGKKADTLIMGRADDYFGGEIPQPSEKIWKPFLHNGSTWEQLSEIRNGNYVFIEEGLSELAPVIGMDKSNILFSVRDASECENVYFLGFRRANAKKEKKLTLKSAFTEVFGNALEPFGFVKLKKTKLPYFVRVIGGDILNVITYRTTGCVKSGYKSMEILFGISSLYNPHMDFIDDIYLRSVNGLCTVFYISDHYPELDIAPRTSTINDVLEFACELWNIDPKYLLNPKVSMYEFKSRIFRFLCSNDDKDKLMRIMNIACNVVKDTILSLMEKVNNNTEFIHYCFSTKKNMELCFDIESFKTETSYYYSEGLMLIKENYLKDTFEYAEKNVKDEVESIKNRSQGLGGAKDVDEYAEIYLNKWAERSEIRKAIINSPELYTTFCKEADKIKEKNLEILEKHGYRSRKEQ